MDALKELLEFDSEAPRITTLTVLRKATSTIQVSSYLALRHLSLNKMCDFHYRCTFLAITTTK